MIFLGGDVSVLKDASLVWLVKPLLVKPCLEEAPFEELYGDIVLCSTTPSIRLIDPIYNEALDLTPISCPLPPTTPSHLHAYHESLRDIRGYNPFFDVYCACLEDVPRKIIGVTSLIMLLIFLLYLMSLRGH